MFRFFCFCFLQFTLDWSEETLAHEHTEWSIFFYSQTISSVKSVVSQRMRQQGGLSRARNFNILIHATLSLKNIITWRFIRTEIAALIRLRESVNLTTNFHLIQFAVIFFSNGTWHLHWYLIVVSFLLLCHNFCETSNKLCKLPSKHSSFVRIYWQVHNGTYIIVLKQWLFNTKQTSLGAQICSVPLSLTQKFQQNHKIKCFM